MKDTSNIKPIAFNNTLDTPIPVTVNKMLINNALVTIYDALNGDDDDTRFEVSLVEQFIDQQAEQIAELEKQLSIKNNDAAVDAMYLHYFAEEVIKQSPDSIGDLFGIGEDCFVLELFPFAQLINKCVDIALEDDRHLSGVFVYDAMEELAGLFIALIMRNNLSAVPMAYEMPKLDQFELAVVQVVEKHSS